MQGISILTDPAGNPSILTVDLKHHAPDVDQPLADLLAILDRAQQQEQSERRFWEAAASDTLRDVWDTPENDAWDAIYQQEHQKGNVPAI